MSPEDLSNEIKLIFARACAEGLKTEAAEILTIKDIDEKERTAKAYGEAFASAFIFVSRYFTPEAELTRPLSPSQAEAPLDQASPSSSSEAEPQRRAKQIHQALGVLLGVEAASSGSDPQQ